MEVGVYVLEVVKEMELHGLEVEVEVVAELEHLA